MSHKFKQKTPKGSRRPKDTANDHITDPRFVNLQTDPRFRLPSRKNTHVQIDKRFAHVLSDGGFSSKAKVDRYGRKLPDDSRKQELRKYYRLEGVSDEESDDDVVVEREINRANAVEGIVSSTASDTSSSEDEEVLSAEEEVFGLLDEQGADGKSVPMGEASPRIAVVNLDWDNIRAIDLMVVFSSFVPAGGRILKIAIYPSDFGRARMEKEELEGPPTEIFGRDKLAGNDVDVSSSEDDESGNLNEQDEEENIKDSLFKEDKGEEFNSSRLRRYQLERLRYYFAVVICSSTPVAQAIYDAIDKTEYLTTANFFDLRFIPDGVEFSADKARDECERVPDGYRPNEFVTDALQHSKVRLTWDADDGARKEVQKRAFGGSRADIDENDLKAYIGSDSSDDELPELTIVAATSVDQPEETTYQSEETSYQSQESSAVLKLSKKDTERQRMRALLGLELEPASKASLRKPASGPVGDMQITFSSGLSSTNKASVFENEPEREETTVERYVRKEKERKNRRKEKMKTARDGGSCKVAVNGEKDGTKSPEPVSTDLGFSDPFFADPSTDNASLKAQRQADRRADLASANVDTAEGREDLERILKNENAANGGQIHHFDATLLAKGEKLASKRGIKKTKHKMSERKKEALEAKAHDDFQIDTQDPRFSVVFERSEYAIDPSHKGFKETEGMKTLLEAGRRKRRRNEKDREPQLGDLVTAKKQRKVKEPKEGADVKTLVEKVKRRSKVK